MPEITLDSTQGEDPSLVPEGAVENPDGSVSVPDDTPTRDGPRKLAGKFDSPEALEKAYEELQRKLGQRGSEEPAAEEAEGEEPAAEEAESDDDLSLRAPEGSKEAEAEGLTWDAVAEELAEKEALSDETYQKLQQERGMSRRDVDAWVAGQKALATQTANEIAEAVGGRENLNAVREWAKTNLSDEEVQAYEDAREAGNTAAMKMILRGIQAQMTAVEGRDPKLVRGENVPRSKGVKPFANTDQMVAAMSDERYQTDPAYRDQVMKRVAASDW